MPHLLLRLSAGVALPLAPNEVLGALVLQFSEVETVRPEAVKAALTVVETYTTGAGHPGEFAHLEVAVLSGRPLELRQKMGDLMHECMRSLWPDARVGVTVEVREMDASTYRKS
jgi:5-carboxymethyl-2-hydroxymuconate isomerase